MTFRGFLGYLGRMLGRDRPPSVPGRLAAAVAAGSELIAGLSRTQPRFTRESVRGTMMQVRYSGAKARALGFTPRVGLEEGMRRVEAW